MRIPVAVNEPYAGAFRQRKIERDLGDIVELDFSPRYAANRYLTFGAWYVLEWKAQDVYTGSFPATTPDDRSITIDAGVLGAETGLTNHLAGLSVSYSTVNAFDRGKAPWPFDIVLSHGQSFAGTGNAPKRFTTQLEAKLYLFGKR
jgi:hypothetical protein